MTGDDPTPIHRAALEVLRGVARGRAVDTAAAELVPALGAAADDERVLAMAVTYLYAARVGGQAAQPEVAMRWLSGWSNAARRSPEEATAALVDGIRFAERLHRTLRIAE